MRTVEVLLAGFCFGAATILTVVLLCDLWDEHARK